MTWVQSLQRWPDLLLRTFKPANSLVANLVCVVSSWHAVVLETYSVPLPQSSFCSTISRPRSVHSRRRHHDRRPARRARSLVSCGPSSSLSGSASNAALFDKLDPLRRNKIENLAPDHDSLPVDVNVDDNSDTELILAVVRNDPDSVQRHLDQLGGRNVVGCTALMFAAAYDYIECARLLLDEVCMQDANGWTALMAAAQQGSEECVASFHTRPVYLI